MSGCRSYHERAHHCRWSDRVSLCFSIYRVRLTFLATPATFLDPVTLELPASPSVVTEPLVFTEIYHTALPPSSFRMSSVHTTSSTLSTRVVTLTEMLLSATTVSSHLARVQDILTNRTQHSSRRCSSRFIMYRPRTRRRSLHPFPNIFPLRSNLIFPLRIRRSRWIRWFKSISQCRYEARMGYEVPRFCWYCLRRCCCGYGHDCLEGIVRDKRTIEK
jgi:hypothetical protein